MIADRLPESQAIFPDEFEAADPFRAFPKIEVRHQQARRPPVLGREGTSVVFVNNPSLSAADVGKWQIRRVTAVANSDEIADGRLRVKVNAFEQRVDRNARPDGVEL